MRAVLLDGPGRISVEDVPDPALVLPSDAIVRVLLTCVCGSDLWPYRGYGLQDGHAHRMGHEFLGIVEDIGSEVRTIRRGDLVVAPFRFCDGDCDFCVAGLPSSCRRGGMWGRGQADGAQGEALRVPFADATLIGVPGFDASALRASAVPNSLAWSLLALADVLGTGHHAALAAGVTEGSRVVVIGDGAVGLSAVLAARLLGASQVVIAGSHEERLRVADLFGATDRQSGRGAIAGQELVDRTGGGFEHVIECVGTSSAWETALTAVRPGGTIGYVGVPHDVNSEFILSRLFGKNIAVAGGLAPVRVYIPALLPHVLSGRIDASPLFDASFSLEQAPLAYRGMDERTVIKAGIRLPQ